MWLDLTANIYLMGFMGAGKTSVGRLLAKRLDSPFIDLDEAIVARQGVSIATIFQEEGEPAFRGYEGDVLASLNGPAVIALGGGAPMVSRVKQVIAQRGLSLFLNWPFEVLRKRVAGDPSRPLAADAEKFRFLFETRLPTYLQADHVWHSRVPHRETVGEIADWCVARLSQQEKSP